MKKLITMIVLVAGPAMANAEEFTVTALNAPVMRMVGSYGTNMNVLVTASDDARELKGQLPDIRKELEGSKYTVDELTIVGNELHTRWHNATTDFQQRCWKTSGVVVIVTATVPSQHPDDRDQVVKLLLEAGVKLDIK